jgi:L-fuconolactonase
MIGSDWPVCTLASPYTRTLAVVEDALAGCSSKERGSILGGTAQHLWNL